MINELKAMVADVKDADIVLICGAGGQAALTGKTLREMGFSRVANVGGFPDWKSAGGPRMSWGGR